MGFTDWLARRKGYVKPDEIKQGRRSFSGAQIGRLTASWTTTPKPADADIRSGLRVLRARSRELSQNNDFAKRFLTLLKSNLVGPKGIVMQARSRDGDRLDTVANNALEAAWAMWGKFGSPDVTGQHSWRSMLELYVTTLARDGEVLLVKHRNWSKNAHRYALEFVDVEALDVDLNQDLGNGRAIRMGIEFDAYRRPVAYYLTAPNAKQDVYSYGSKKYRRVAADRVIHRFLIDSAWQSRGVPWMAAGMMRMKMLDGYEEAELVAARVASSKMGFFKSPTGDAYTGDDMDDDGNVMIDAEPGTFEDIGNRDFVSWDPAHPSTAYDSFIKGCLRGIAAGMGLSYHTLANDLEGVNYSSARIGALEDRELWKTLQEWIVESFCDVVYQDWIEGALLTGIKLQSGGTLSPGKLLKYREVSWQARRWAWVDPQKDMNAASTAIENNIRSISDVIREQGKDPDEVWLEIAAERKRMKELGIEPAQVAGFLMAEEGGDDA